MCNSPRTISVRRKNFTGLIRSQMVISSAGFHESVTSPFIKVDVPCGHCAECIKKKRKSLEVRFMREAEVNPLMFFVTLTYRNNKLPVSISTYVLDKETGEEYLYQKPSIVVPRFNKETLKSSLDVPRMKLLSNIRSYNNLEGIERFEEIIFEDHKYRFFARLVPSLCRRDVRLWIKRCRVRYEREFGVKVPDFRYYIIGEMGFNTNRPHYHCCFFGLPQKCLEYFLQSWREDFGFVYSEKVYAKNKDGSNAYMLVARYVAKYITKEGSECQYVLDGDVEKPRVMSSISFGVGDVSEFLKDYYLGSRFYGRYDPSNMRFLDGSSFSHDQIAYLADYISRHLYFDINGYKYPMPGLVRKRIFGIYETYIKDGKIISKFVRWSPIYLLAMAFARDRYLADIDRKYRQRGLDFGSENFSEALMQVNSILSSAARFENMALQKADIQSYKRSKI